MTISLIDVDGHHFPNLALMKLSAWKKLLLQGGTYEAGEGEEKVYGAVACERAGVLPVGQRDRRVPRRRDKEKILRKVR